ncbi:MAG: MFS transporter [Megasphaera sp.]|uniref:MFS transporter n=1 Tax=Megasphaera sp. TaxID=2023260 RepID=UPI003F07A52E
MEKSLWTKPFIFGTLVNFLLVLNYYLLMIIMTKYAAEEYQASSSLAGLSASLFVIGALLARFVAPRFMESLGPKKLMTAAILLEIITSCGYLGAANLFLLFLIRLGHGLSYGLASTAISTVVTGLIPKGKKGEGIGYFMLSITVGAAIGPFLGIFLLQHGSYLAIFIACIAAAVFGLAASLKLPAVAGPEVRQAVLTENKDQDHAVFSLFEVKALSISLICAGIYFCYSSIIAFLTPYAEVLDLQEAASFFFIVYSLAILITRPFTGKFFDSRGERCVMVPAFLSFIVGMILLGCAGNGILLLASAAFLGFGVGVIQSCGLAIAVKRSPAHRLSYVNSTFYFFIDAGTGIGPFLLGFSVPLIGYSGMYLAMAGLAVICAGLYLQLGRGPVRTSLPDLEEEPALSVSLEEDP